MPRATWQARLHYELGKVYEEFHPDRVLVPRNDDDLLRLIAGTLPAKQERRAESSSLLDIEAVLSFIKGATAEQRTLVRQMLAYVDDTAWAFREATPSSATKAEHEEFAATQGGRALHVVENELSGTNEWITGHEGAVSAALILVAWDLRYVLHPMVTRILREAQLSDDKRLLRSIGTAIGKNNRYGRRQKREQRLLSRVLAQLAYGGRRTFDDDVYATSVQNRLLRAYEVAGVPLGDKGHDLLLNRERYLKHLIRIELRKSGGRKKANSVRTKRRD